jgi:TolB-like protein/Tfp pilus assembly protein PilF
LFSELKRRNVIRVVTAYVVVSWLLIQVAETIFPLFGFGDAPARLVVIVLAVGFIPALVLSWAFELTPEGLRRDSEIDRTQSIAPQTGKRLDRIIMVVLALALGFFAFDKFVLGPARDVELAEAARQEGRSEAIVEQYGDKSIAVLPFADLSPEKDQEYFSDGITEELLNLLASVPDLRVISRTSAFSFKDKDLSLGEIAKALDVAYLLEGSVRKQGGQVRITVQLIEAGTDRHLWSENYDRELSNIFAVQDDVATNVLDRLKVSLLNGAPTVRVVDPVAYNLYLQAMHIRRDGSKDATQRSLELFEEAVTIDSTFIDAWLQLSKKYRGLHAHMLITEGEARELEINAINQAVALEPDNPRVLARLSDISSRDGDLASAAAFLNRALGTGSQDIEVLYASAMFLENLLRFEGAAVIWKATLSEDPVYSSIHYRIGFDYVLLHEWEQARQALEAARRLSPQGPGIANLLAYTMIELGDPEAALQWALDEPSPNWHNVALLWAHDALGNKAQADAALAQLMEADPTYAIHWIAAAYATRGELDLAMDYLEQEGTPDNYLRFAPWFDRLHGHPRWEAYLDKAPHSMEELAAIEFVIP